MLKNYIFFAFGVVGAFISNLFGGWDAALTTLVICMFIDYISGIIVAGVFHKSRKTASGGLKSLVGWQGICKKIVTLLCVLIACRMDLMLHANYIRDATIIAFVANEILSIVENCGLMGIPLPEAIVKGIDLLKSKVGDEH